ncbi:RNA polymerase sigma-70 factor (ECF subfamily) [Salirhabdus euzebyi]|uniref:RNA polymerase sigma factor n=1 Tax=Salirhabdus euzebyi TaxID=394506 RepID=A0A841Q1L3_9BACI|nr:RNA polymerase sigma factor [Salirhabdus euzebyi]MBB6451715.1 RNA polymerase sigma-70 factor (ECF subfamily) [Salirhabdus euzebyi]
MSRESTISDWFNEYGNDVYRFLVFYTGTLDVEDLVQEVFIKAIKNLHTFKNKSSPKTWLFIIARNLAIDEMRSNKKSMWKKLITIEDAGDLLSPSEQNPETIFLNKQYENELNGVIQLLNKNYREVIILRSVNQLSVSETAAVLNWSNEKVRTNYYRAIKAIRKQWRDNSE